MNVASGRRLFGRDVEKKPHRGMGGRSVISGSIFVQHTVIARLIVRIRRALSVRANFGRTVVTSMCDAPRSGIEGNVMKESALQRTLAGLVSEITTPPAGKGVLVALPGQEHEAAKSLASSRTVAESLDYLRVSIKYLLFDLEATRRENAYLRKLIEQQSCEAEQDE
jgi:hypothetical protein